MADLGGGALEAGAAKVRAAATNPDSVRSFAVDVSSLDDVRRLKTSVYDAFGEVAVLMNNAGTGGGGDLFGDPARWRRILDVNLWGVINGVQAFAPDMIKQGTADRQHGLEAGDHLSARRHRLQCLKGGREGRDRGARARIAQRRGWSRQRASAHSGVRFHFYDQGLKD
jgi:NAD(P)-dependent dehydrogenase (short-subunit alcohol dehydrogenase family)